MAASLFSPEALNQYWQILKMFIIPLGFGITPGVLLAKKFKTLWWIILILYFISDLLLAIVFEPLLLLIIRLLKDKPNFQQAYAIFKESFKKTTEHLGTDTGPLALIIVAFGADPMSGRAIAKAHGHGFISGWLIAITGDMLYFAVLMVCTLWLNDIIGDDGTKTTTIMIILMLLLPGLIKKIRQKIKGN